MQIIHQWTWEKPIEVDATGVVKAIILRIIIAARKDQPKEQIVIGKSFDDLARIWKAKRWSRAETHKKLKASGRKRLLAKAELAIDSTKRIGHQGEGKYNLLKIVVDRRKLEDDWRVGGSHQIAGKYQ